jgi:D-inositol-3-phosphate glycosyltransferase
VKTLAERRNGIEWRLRAMRRLWHPAAEPAMPFLAPLQVGDAESESEAGPSGKIDLPKTDEAVSDDALTIAGWACFPDGFCRRVEVWLDSKPLGRARVGVVREDVAAIVAMPYAETSGFELTLDATALRRERAGEPLPIRAVATSDKGTTFEPEPIEMTFAPLPAAKPRKMAPSIAPTPKSSPRPRVLIVTHQLSLGGAQLYLMDLIRGLLELGAIDPVVVATTDGPLHEDLEDLGIPVHVSDLLTTSNLSSHRGRIEELLAWTGGFEFDLVLINTATSPVIPGGEIAAGLGVPAIWAIHESFEPALLWGDLQPEVRANAEAVIGEATFAVFEADATRQIYEPLIDPARCRVLPYGLDLAPIDAQRADFDRDRARTTAGIDPSARLVVCIGTIEPRKGQIPLVESFEQIGESHPDAHLAFVGGRPKDPYTEALEARIATYSRPDQIEVIPITPAIGSWYGMADLLVCASDVESLPRTVLEAMAWETPVLATSVFGLPELIDDGETGWLCDARDTAAMATALDRALSAPRDTYDAIAHRARSLVEVRHSQATYAEEIAKLVEEALRTGPGKP